MIQTAPPKSNCHSCGEPFGSIGLLVYDHVHHELRFAHIDLWHERQRPVERQRPSGFHRTERPRTDKLLNLILHEFFTEHALYKFQSIDDENDRAGNCHRTGNDFGVCADRRFHTNAGRCMVQCRKLRNFRRRNLNPANQPKRFDNPSRAWHGLGGVKFRFWRRIHCRI